MGPPTPGWPLVAGALLVVLAGGLALMRTRRR
jgi:MYXO-CTERM domain-containing protein